MWMYIMCTQCTQYDSEWWFLIKCIPAEEEKTFAPNVASPCNSQPAIKISQIKHFGF